MMVSVNTDDTEGGTPMIKITIPGNGIAFGTVLGAAPLCGVGGMTISA